jgi:RNA polymerase sigma-70 factor (ECF subfamily)
MEDRSDEALMLEYAKGKGKNKTKAFEVLYRPHKDSLYRFVRRQCREPDITYDLVHEIWFKVIRGSRRYQPRAKFTTYLFTLARNRMVDYYRAQAARMPATQFEPDEADLEDVLDQGQHDPEMRAHIRDLLERSLERIYRLPRVQQEAVLMYAEGLTPGEIADITQVSVDTARSRVRGGLARLREDLGGLLS